MYINKNKRKKNDGLNFSFVTESSTSILWTISSFTWHKCFNNMQGNLPEVSHMNKKISHKSVRDDVINLFYLFLIHCWALHFISLSAQLLKQSRFNLFNYLLFIFPIMMMSNYVRLSSNPFYSQHDYLFYSIRARNRQQTSFCSLRFSIPDES